MPGPILLPISIIRIKGQFFYEIRKIIFGFKKNPNPKRPGSLISK